MGFDRCRIAGQALPLTVVWGPKEVVEVRGAGKLLYARSTEHPRALVADDHRVAAVAAAQAVHVRAVLVHQKLILVVELIATLAHGHGKHGMSRFKALHSAIPFTVPVAAGEAHEFPS